MTGTLTPPSPSAGTPAASPRLDWKRIAYFVLASRGVDDTEEKKLIPEKKVVYQFSARGHELAQIILGSLLDGEHDAAGAYYRSRPLLLTLGLSLEDAFAGPLRKSGGFSDGRDIGVVCNLPKQSGPIVLPMSGDVGSQYTPSVGWAQAITYHREVLSDRSYDRSIAVVLGGEASVATNGFWSCLTMATTLKLPLLFYVEDNGLGISVRGGMQTPGGNIAANLASFANLLIRDGDGTNPGQTAAFADEVVAHVRSGSGPARRCHATSGGRCYPCSEGSCRRFSTPTTSARAARRSNWLPASLSRAPTKEFSLALVPSTEERIRRCSGYPARCSSPRDSPRNTRSPSGRRRRRGHGRHNRSQPSQAPPR